MKDFRGTSKNYSGEQILNAILEDKKTAGFITRKLYRSFVSDQHISNPVVDAWADSFYRSGYHIGKLIESIFQSKEFNDPVNMGNRIKSPVELLMNRNFVSTHAAISTNDAEFMKGLFIGFMALPEYQMC